MKALRGGRVCIRPVELRIIAACLAIGMAVSLFLLWPASGKSNLVIYSAMGPPGGLIPAFEKAAGLRVTYINMGGGPLQARIYAEGAHPRWNVAWFAGDAAMAALDQASLLVRHASSDSDWTGTGAARPIWTDTAHAVLPSDGSYAPTGLTLAGVFVTLRSSPVPTRNWQSLPSYPGAVGMVSPVASGTAYPVLSAMMEAAGGVASGHALLLALRRHDLGIAASNPLLLGQLRTGDISLAVLPSETAYTAAKRDPAIRVTLPEPVGVMPAVLGVSVKASPAARRAAGLFVRFLLTPEGQRLIRTSTAEGLGWAPVEHVAAPADLPPLHALVLVHPDAGLWGRREGREVGWFRREITG